MMNVLRQYFSRKGRATDLFELSALKEALDKSQAVISFDIDGTILDANDNFLSVMGYTLDEIVGQHHSMFVDPEYKQSPDYGNFWAALKRGEYQAAEYKRYGKAGREVWIQASYNPICDPSGVPVKVIKYATDITQEKLRNAEYSGQVNAINKSQAVISFDLDGTVLDANDNFLSVMGYTLDEIVGRHHSMFVDPDYKQSSDYKDFWASLKRGEYQAAEYKRYGKAGREVWIQASYTPIFDPSGVPFRVVKYATDITEKVIARIEAEKADKLMDENVDNILASINDANQQSSSATKSSNDTLEMVQAIAAAAEEFAVSATEIAKSMELSKTVVEDVLTQAANADASTNELTSAAQSMNNIVLVIQEIASQINLLALNATIESARAGEAGKGFAVVASEVKSLASQVEGATTQISSEIENMQTVSDGVVEQLLGIKTLIEKMEASLTTVSSAVEEQTATSQEMTGNIQTAANAVNEIDVNLKSISESVETANEFTEKVTALYRSMRA